MLEALSSYNEIGTNQKYDQVTFDVYNLLWALLGVLQHY